MPCNTFVAPLPASVVHGCGLSRAHVSCLVLCLVTVVCPDQVSRPALPDSNEGAGVVWSVWSKCASGAPCLVSCWWPPAATRTCLAAIAPIGCSKNLYLNLPIVAVGSSSSTPSQRTPLGVSHLALRLWSSGKCHWPPLSAPRRWGLLLLRARLDTPRRDPMYRRTG